METRSKAKIIGSKSQPRATTVGGTQPGQTNSTTSVNSHRVNLPSSPTGSTRGGQLPFRFSSQEGGPRRTFNHVPRNESAGGAGGSPDGSPNCRRGKARGSGDADGEDTSDCTPPVVAAESGTTHHHPDEGTQPEFTMVPWRGTDKPGLCCGTPNLGQA